MAKTEEEFTIEQMFIDRERLKQEKSFSLFVMCGGVAQRYFSEYFRSTRLKNEKNYGIINIENENKKGNTENVEIVH